MRLAAPIVVVTVAACAANPPAPPEPALRAVASAPASSPSPTVAASAAPVDTDGDRIPDADDKCPTEPETYNGRDDEDGCPDNVVVVVTSNPPPIVLVQFENGSSKPRPESKSIVDEVANVLNGHPEIELVQIEGHAAKGEANGLKLSQERADAVRQQIVAKGIDQKRLRAKGFGAYCPGPFANADRRVEFKIVTRDGKPTGTALGCPAATAAGITSP